MPPPVQVAITPTHHPVVGEKGYKGCDPHTETLPKGWTMQEGARALSDDMVVDHDVAIKVRDGCMLYCDVYRPVGSEKNKVPAIVAWSPYGKKFNGIDMMSHVSCLFAGIDG
jgi:predicted acyl esterase